MNRVSTDQHGGSNDNRRLSAKQPRSDEDLADAIARLVRALGRRCKTGDPDTAQLLRLIQAELDDAFTEGVAGWRKSGFTDTEIGRELGVTKQAVQKRWPR